MTRRLGLAIVVMALLGAVAGPWIWPIDAMSQSLAERLTGPSWAHPLGQDELGRDLLARLLLLSPDVFDLSRPITVVADGRTVFNGPVRKSVEVLVSWAAKDNDRTMLYGAALPITLAP